MHATKAPTTALPTPTGEASKAPEPSTAEMLPGTSSRPTEDSQPRVTTAEAKLSSSVSATTAQDQSEGVQTGSTAAPIQRTSSRDMPVQTEEVSTSKTQTQGASSTSKQTTTHCHHQQGQHQQAGLMRSSNKCKSNAPTTALPTPTGQASKAPEPSTAEMLPGTSSRPTEDSPAKGDHSRGQAIFFSVSHHSRSK